MFLQYKHLYRLPLFASFLLPFLWSACSEDETAVITGFLEVIAQVNGQPLPETTISLVGTERKQITNEQGIARIVGIAVGEYTLRVDNPRLGVIERLVTVEEEGITRVFARYDEQDESAATTFRWFPDSVNISRLDEPISLRVSLDNQNFSSGILLELSTPTVGTLASVVTDRSTVLLDATSLPSGAYPFKLRATDPNGAKDSVEFNFRIQDEPAAPRIDSVSLVGDRTRLKWTATDYKADQLALFRYYNDMPAERPWPINGRVTSADTVLRDELVPYGFSVSYYFRATTSQGDVAHGDTVTVSFSEGAVRMPEDIRTTIWHPARPEAYALGASGAIYVVDYAANRIVATMSDGMIGERLALDPDKDLLYTIGSDRDHVAIFNVRDYTKVGEITIEGVDLASFRFRGLSLTFAGKDRLLIAGGGALEPTLFSAVDGSVLATISGRSPFSVTTVPPYNKFYFYNERLYRYRLTDDTRFELEEQVTAPSASESQIFLSADGSVLFFTFLRYDPNDLTNILDSYPHRISGITPDGLHYFNGDEMYSTETTQLVQSFRSGVGSSTISPDGTLLAFMTRDSRNTFYTLVTLPYRP